MLDTKRKLVKRESLQSDLSREYLLNEAAIRADYFYRKTDGDYCIPSPDGQVTQLIEMLLEASIKPPAPDKEMIKRAYKAGFIAACKWPSPVTQDVDSKAFDAEMQLWWQQQSSGGGE